MFKAFSPFPLFHFLCYTDRTSYFLIGGQVSTFKDNEVYFVTPKKSFASDWLMCGQNIGSGTNAPITVSGTLLLASTLAAMKGLL